MIRNTYEKPNNRYACPKCGADAYGTKCGQCGFPQPHWCRWPNMAYRHLWKKIGGQWWKRRGSATTGLWWSYADGVSVREGPDLEERCLAALLEAGLASLTANPAR